MVSGPLKLAGTTVSYAGKALNALGEAAEDVGHHVNKAFDEFGNTFNKEFQRDPSVLGAARAAAVATATVAGKVHDYVNHRLQQGIDAVNDGLHQAGSWYSHNMPSWLGGGEDKPAPQQPHPASAAPAPAHPNAPQAHHGVMLDKYALQSLEKAGLLHHNNDTSKEIAELGALLKKNGHTLSDLDKNHDGVVTGTEIQAAITPKGTPAPAQHAGR